MEPTSPANLLVQNWVRIHSHEDQEFEPQTEDDETLSLCDLATNGHDHPAANYQEQRFSDEHEEDFDFAGGSSNSPENKMCSADELFFRGQIMPLTSGFMTRTRGFTRSVSFSRSEPVSGASSRSSSTRSHNSGTSGSTSGSEFTGYKPILRNRNQFHSHPSPTPQIRTRSSRHSNPRTQSKFEWRFLQLGPVKPQEIGLVDLKNRSQRSSLKDKNEKKKRNHMLLFGDCKCSANVVETAVSSTVKPAISRKEAETTRLGISKESNVGPRKYAHN